MILSKKDLKNRYSSGSAAICALIVLALLLVVPSTGSAAGEPKTVAEIALYQGPDREKILIEGAKKEGQLIFYNVNTWLNDVVTKQFEKKYPFIKVSSWRSDAPALLKRVVEEYTARHFIVDAIESNPQSLLILNRRDMLQEYYSPELAYYGDEVKLKGKNGVYYCAVREDYCGLGFNTKLIPLTEVPKTLEDLLDPKWKGKMSIPTSSTGIWWIGNALEAKGRAYLEKLALQDLRVQSISGAGMANLVVSGEVPLSPTIWSANIVVAKGKGAPVEWQPLEPVVVSVGYAGITTKAPHPHAALLFLDYIQSREGQKVVTEGGISSPRVDIESLAQKIKKKNFVEGRYSLEEYQKKSQEWEDLMKQLYIIKKK